MDIYIYKNTPPTIDRANKGYAYYKIVGDEIYSRSRIDVEETPQMLKANTNYGGWFINDYLEVCNNVEDISTEELLQILNEAISLSIYSDTSVEAYKEIAALVSPENYGIWTGETSFNGVTINKIIVKPEDKGRYVYISNFGLLHVHKERTSSCSYEHIGWRNE